MDLTNDEILRLRSGSAAGIATSVAAGIVTAAGVAAGIVATTGVTAGIVTATSVAAGIVIATIFTVGVSVFGVFFFGRCCIMAAALLFRDRICREIFGDSRASG